MTHYVTLQITIYVTLYDPSLNALCVQALGVGVCGKEVRGLQVCGFRVMGMVLEPQH